jgi:serine/threonine-protein kinase
MREVSAPVDRYEVHQFLAEGGMGSIYLGKKRGAGGFEKEVVLKQLRPEYTEQPAFIELFLREARLSAVLDHANIVHTLDLVSAGADWFMVMEYVRGGDLRVLMKRARKRHRRLSPRAAIFIAREVLSALVYAHGRKGKDGQPLGLIHRDVSPSNILVSGAGEVKLTDFGIAKATTHHSTFYRVRGKVGYMSPEQAKSQPLQARSDVYSLAIILWEMLVGERLFVAQSLTTSADELYGQPVPPVSQRVPGLPRELDWVLARGLAVDPTARYQSAGELMEALLTIAAKHDLGFSALELARHLVEICGPVEEWGSTVVRESGESLSQAAEPGGTEPLAEGPPDGEGDGGADDLVWVGELDQASRALERERPHADAPAQVASMPLAPVAEFHVEDIAPSVARPRRRLPGFVVALVAVTVAIGGGRLALLGAGSAPSPAVAPAPAPPPRPAPPKPVKLAIDSDPPRARVLIAGQPRCATPCTVDAAAPPAVTAVRLEHDGFLPWTALVVPSADGVKARLRRPGGVPLTFTGVSEANLLEGGKPIGYATPGDAPLVLPAGDHTLELVTPDGRARREVRVTLKPGQPATVDLATR